MLHWINGLRGGHDTGNTTVSSSSKKSSTKDVQPCLICRPPLVPDQHPRCHAFPSDDHKESSNCLQPFAQTSSKLQAQLALLHAMAARQHAQNFLQVAACTPPTADICAAVRSLPAAHIAAHFSDQHHYQQLPWVLSRTVRVAPVS